MPNWCANTVTVTHDDPNQLEQLHIAMLGGRFFRHVIPIPECLEREGSSSYGGADAEQYDKLREENVKLTGYTDWYDFTVKRWGTKWDVDCDAVDLDETTKELSCSFDSAWGPPIGIYDELSGLGFKVEAFYHEPGMMFAGKYSNGRDEYVDYTDETAETVREAVGEELDDYFGITESLEE